MAALKTALIDVGPSGPTLRSRAPPGNLEHVLRLREFAEKGVDIAEVISLFHPTIMKVRSSIRD